MVREPVDSAGEGFNYLGNRKFHDSRNLYEYRQLRELYQRIKLNNTIDSGAFTLFPDNNFLLYRGESEVSTIIEHIYVLVYFSTTIVRSRKGRNHDRVVLEFSANT